MKNGVTAWDEIRKLSDELELQVHLAGLDARDRWHALKPQIEELGQVLEDTGKRASAAVEQRITAVMDALRRLREDVTKAIKN